MSMRSESLPPYQEKDPVPRNRASTIAELVSDYYHAVGEEREKADAENGTQAERKKQMRYRSCWPTIHIAASLMFIIITSMGGLVSSPGAIDRCYVVASSQGDEKLYLYSSGHSRRLSTDDYSLHIAILILGTLLNATILINALMVFRIVRNDTWAYIYSGDAYDTSTGVQLVSKVILDCIISDVSYIIQLLVCVCAVVFFVVRGDYTSGVFAILAVSNILNLNILVVRWQGKQISRHWTGFWVASKALEKEVKGRWQYKIMRMLGIILLMDNVRSFIGPARDHESDTTWRTRRTDHKGCFWRTWRKLDATSDRFHWEPMRASTGPT